MDNKMDDKTRIKIMRSDARMLMAILFILLFAGWIGALIFLALSVEPSTFEAFGMGAITGALISVLTNVYQFFFRRASKDEESDKS